MFWFHVRDQPWCQYGCVCIVYHRQLRHLNFGGAEGQVLNKCVIESGPECGPLCSPQGMEIYIHPPAGSEGRLKNTFKK